MMIKSNTRAVPHSVRTIKSGVESRTLAVNTLFDGSSTNSSIISRNIATSAGYLPMECMLNDLQWFTLCVAKLIRLGSVPVSTPNPRPRLLRVVLSTPQGHTAVLRTAFKLKASNVSRLKLKEVLKNRNCLLKGMHGTALPICYITRTEQFSACHRLNSVHLSTEENRNIFGKCNNPNGHGHNYKLEVTVRNSVDPTTGMVMDLSQLKLAIHQNVLDLVDHKNLDKDVEYFRDNGIVSTTENLAIFIWKQLSSALPRNVLYEVKIFETEKNAVVYRGEVSPP